MGLERRVKVADVALRCVVCGLAALAAALVGTASQTRTFFSLEKKARFTDMRALVFLVGAHAAAAGMQRWFVLKSYLSTTTSRRLADRKSAKFQKNITKRGSVPETTVKKGNDYPVGPMVLGFFIFVVIGSSPKTCSAISHVSLLVFEIAGILGLKDYRYLIV
uniref:CASP-like protein n=1 Tax=Oryza brachyantha TaxID=4533 RepID=J3NDS2_ORYBR